MNSLAQFFQFVNGQSQAQVQPSMLHYMFHALHCAQEQQPPTFLTNQAVGNESFFDVIRQWVDYDLHKRHTKLSDHEFWNLKDRTTTLPDEKIISTLDRVRKMTHTICSDILVQYFSVDYSNMALSVIADAVFLNNTIPDDYTRDILRKCCDIFHRTSPEISERLVCLNQLCYVYLHRHDDLKDTLATDADWEQWIAQL